MRGKSEKKGGDMYDLLIFLVVLSVPSALYGLAALSAAWRAVAAARQELAVSRATAEAREKELARLKRRMSVLASELSDAQDALARAGENAADLAAALLRLQAAVRLIHRGERFKTRLHGGKLEVFVAGQFVPMPQTDWGKAGVEVLLIPPAPTASPKP